MYYITKIRRHPTGYGRKEEVKKMKDTRYEREIKNFIREAEWIKANKPEAKLVVLKKSNTGAVWFEPKTLLVCDTVFEIEDWLSRNQDKWCLLSNDYTSKIADLEEKLKDYEDKWYSKFSKMETALAKMQSNASAITGLLGGS